MFLARGRSITHKELIVGAVLAPIEVAFVIAYALYGEKD